jgi:RNA polymerase sigma-70 factor (ECF subfamily)
LIDSILSDEERHPVTSTLATLEDSCLIDRALEGQAECFTLLMDRYLVALRKRIGVLVPNEPDAEDVLQEVLLKVWLHLASFRAESSFGTWVMRVAINEALQFYRRARCRPRGQAPADLGALVFSGDSPYQSVARVEVTRAVRSAVVGLPEKYRRVLILRDLEQRTERETAQWLQMNVPAVKTRLFRARQMLLTEIQRTGIRGLATAGNGSPEDLGCATNTATC